MATKKPAPKTVKPGKRKLLQPKPAPVAVDTPSVEPVYGEIAAIVRANWIDIFVLHGSGKSLDEIGAKLEPRPLTGVQIRTAIKRDEELNIRWQAVREQRASTFIEKAAEAAQKLADGGLYNEAATQWVRIAEKTAPDLFGPKQTVELTGRGGGPIESTVTMSPREAYEAMRGHRAV